MRLGDVPAMRFGVAFLAALWLARTVPRVPMKTSRLIGVLVLLSVFKLTSAHSAPGDEHWDNRFGRPGVSNFVYALTARDGKLYAGGIFVQPTGVTNNQVDVW